MNDFEDIYRRHYAQMYRLARTMLYEPQESKDVVSDVFARLLRKGHLPWEEKMEGYLMTAVRNQCRDVLSHKSIRERLTQFIEAELSPLSQQIFRLRFLREMSYEEVAQATGVSKVTVYNHLAQSLQRIREHFSKKTAKR